MHQSPLLSIQILSSKAPFIQKKTAAQFCAQRHKSLSLCLFHVSLRTTWKNWKIWGLDINIRCLYLGCCVWHFWGEAGLKCRPIRKLLLCADWPLLSPTPAPPAETGVLQTRLLLGLMCLWVCTQHFFLIKHDSAFHSNSVSFHWIIRNWQIMLSCNEIKSWWHRFSSWVPLSHCRRVGHKEML